MKMLDMINTTNDKIIASSIIMSNRKLLIKYQQSNSLSTVIQLHTITKITTTFKHNY